jgi:hypothetical protein
MPRLCAIILLAAAALHAQKPANVWAPIEFLLGDWVGEGGGGPGQGSGEFSFHKDLDAKVAVRKNFAEYPATKDRPALRHEDLMIVYPSNGSLRAIYFDNDGYVINYAVQGTQDSVVFLSDALPSAQRFRLTYERTSADAVSLKFEIAPPGKPDAFATYIQARVRRKR